MGSITGLVIERSRRSGGHSSLLAQFCWVWPNSARPLRSIKPGMVGRCQVVLDDLAGQIDRQLGTPFGQRPQGRVGGRFDLVQRPQPLRPRPLAWPRPGSICLSRSAFRRASSRMPRTSSPAAASRASYLATSSVGFFVLPFGVGDVVGDLVLALFQAGQDRPPGELPQHRQAASRTRRTSRSPGRDRPTADRCAGWRGSVGFGRVRQPLLGTRSTSDSRPSAAKRRARRSQRQRRQQSQPTRENPSQTHDETSLRNKKPSGFSY